MYYNNLFIIKFDLTLWIHFKFKFRHDSSLDMINTGIKLINLQSLFS